MLLPYFILGINFIEFIPEISMLIVAAQSGKVALIRIISVLNLKTNTFDAKMVTERIIPKPTIGCDTSLIGMFYRIETVQPISIILSLGIH